MPTWTVNQALVSLRLVFTYVSSFHCCLSFVRPKYIGKERHQLELDWRLSVLESDIRAMNVRYSSSADQSQSNVVSNSDRPTGYLKLLQNLVLQGSQQTKIGEV